jgi:hypothetical protein
MTPLPRPAWAQELASLYACGAANQFILHGNVQDKFLMPAPPGINPDAATSTRAPGSPAAPSSPADGAELGSLDEYLIREILPRFDVILTYDIGDGLVVRKEPKPNLVSSVTGKINDIDPFVNVAAITLFLRYIANIPQPWSVAVIIKEAALAIPRSSSAAHGSTAVRIKNWTHDVAITRSNVAVILLTDELANLHETITSNGAAAKLKVDLPSPAEIGNALSHFAATHGKALESFRDNLPALADGLVGITLQSIDRLIKTHQHRAAAIDQKHIAGIRKQLVEQDSDNLIEFMESTRSLDDLVHCEAVKRQIRQDVELWNAGKLQAVPMGYGVFAPVGCGKNFLVECIAGEAGVPVVTIKNFRDKFVGNTEANLEKIFRLIDSLKRVFVFIDEADQSIGRREGSSTDGGLSGRIYSMLATKMSNPANRGRIVWVLATSRPDLLEVDLKRPGRLDVKIPLFPCGSSAEAFAMLRALCRKFKVQLPEESAAQIEPALPPLLTAGAAQALASKIYRTIEVDRLDPTRAALDALTGYVNPVPLTTLENQIRLAIRECSDIDFVPDFFRHRYADVTPAQG